jgi:alanine-glyoxylate transaminase/serine-glyoxylate transaminase/serine-pyruvate transaminase
MMPEGYDADAFRRDVLARYDMSLGMGLGRLLGRVFRIGHLGFFNELTLCGTLCGVEMGLAASRVPHQRGGVDAALAYLSSPEPDSPRTAEDSAGPARAAEHSLNAA